MKHKKRGCVSRFFRVGCSALALFTLIIAALGLYASKIETQWIETTRHDVKFENFPADAPPLKIVLISDTHCSRLNTVEYIDRVVGLVNSEEPDIVLLGGDFNSAVEFSGQCANSLKNIKSKLGTYAVFGGHDFQQGPKTIKRDLIAAGINVIRDENINVYRNVWLIAVGDAVFGKADVNKAFHKVPDNAVRIVMTHDPAMFPKLKDRNCVVFSGHTHAGQIDIPGIPRNHFPGLLRCQYIRGWFHDGNSRLYVNRGIGTVALYLRFRARPEISVFNISQGTPVTAGMKVNDPIDKNSPMRRLFMRIVKSIKPSYLKKLYKNQFPTPLSVDGGAD